MLSIPSERCEEVPPFTHVGYDCFGPFVVKDGRKEFKRYGVIFSCFGSRAIHIEVVNDLTTDSFINALRCFIAIRGYVSTIYSDRGTNFVGARNELQKAMSEMSDERISQFLANQQCHFVFNVPSSSHMAGACERMIRIVKQVLDGISVQASSRLDTSSLRTLLYEVMAIVNSRPISCVKLSDSHSQPEPLTPNHLLTMKIQHPLPPPGKFESEDLYSRKRWRRVQSLAEYFWSRWRHEYLSTLQPRQKWHSLQRDIEINDIVLVSENNLVRSRWRLGRVVSTHPSKDGRVRKVSIQTGTSGVEPHDNSSPASRILERPIHKCIILVPAKSA